MVLPPPFTRALLLVPVVRALVTTRRLVRCRRQPLRSEPIILIGFLPTCPLDLGPRQVGRKANGTEFFKNKEGVKAFTHMLREPPPNVLCTKKTPKREQHIYIASTNPYSSTRAEPADDFLGRRQSTPLPKKNPHASGLTLLDRDVAWGFWRERSLPPRTVPRPRPRAPARPSARAPAGPASRASGSPSQPALPWPAAATGGSRVNGPPCAAGQRSILGRKGRLILFFFPMNQRRTDAQ